MKDPSVELQGRVEIAWKLISGFSIFVVLIFGWLFNIMVYGARTSAEHVADNRVETSANTKSIEHNSKSIEDIRERVKSVERHLRREN